MIWLDRFFVRRADHRCEPSPDIAQLQRDLEERLMRRKAARLEPSPHKRGHITRSINRGAYDDRCNDAQVGGRREDPARPSY